MTAVFCSSHGRHLTHLHAHKYCICPLSIPRLSQQPFCINQQLLTSVYIKNIFNLITERKKKLLLKSSFWRDCSDLLKSSKILVPVVSNTEVTPTGLNVARARCLVAGDLIKVPTLDEPCVTGCSWNVHAGPSLNSRDFINRTETNYI